MDMRKPILRDDQGLTTTAMVVALLVSLALIFSSAQLYRVHSASAGIQEVADAAVLAAENEVAEFMVAVRVCDAVVLSLSLLSTCMYGVGVVALCVPPAASLSAKVIELASKVSEARDAFAEKASAGLNALQKALPFIAAANAAAVASANGGDVAGSQYFAAAVLVPAQGEDIAVGSLDEASELGAAVDADADAIREAAADAERAAEQADEAKRRGFARDCGENPAYCMYERAGSLAGLEGESNPLYQSVDTWSFSVALKRAQSYYRARLEREAPLSGGVEEQANSALRKRFYAYACDELSRGYVHEEDGGFEADFPRLYRNTDELRSTALYDEAVYPVTKRGGTLTMHAWSGCPEAAGPVRNGTVRELEAGGFETCPSCRFTASSLGNVAAASTSIDNGFEYHYAAVAQAAEDYEQARAELDPKTAEVKEKAGSLLDRCGALASSAGSMRIAAAPPGCKGAIAMVVDTSSLAADTGFESLFVGGGQTLGARAAVSGATLAEDPAHDGASVVSSLLDGFEQDGGAAVGAARIVLDAWSGLLGAFSDGQQSLTDAVEGALDSVPLASLSGLGEWAADGLRHAFEAAGLAPADLDALKPVLVNTGYVAGADEGGFSVAFMTAKERALSLSASSTSLFTALVDDVEADAFSAVERVEEGVVVARIELPVGGVSIPVTLALPPTVTDQAAGLVSRCADAVRSLYGTVTGTRVWS